MSISENQLQLWSMAAQPPPVSNSAGMNGFKVKIKKNNEITLLEIDLINSHVIT